MSESKEYTPTPRIKGLVAQLLSERELVINVGSSGGVRKGMRFRVLSDTPLEVRDPKTQEILDVIDREKTQVEAAEVREKMTICRTFRTIKTGRSFDLSEVMLGGPSSRPETLRTKDSSFLPAIPESESYVKINDRVEQMDE